MKALKLKGSKDEPKVMFDNQRGELFMGGSSLPENVIEFFNPIMQWLNEYKINATPTTQMDFNFDYLNTASTNMMARIIETLEEVGNQSEDVIINWYYSSGDYDMKELGSDLLEETKCKYNIIEVAV